ncbi:hypothetical protein MBLNU457_g0180t1 [Dothideomycetes sp. NU457]
MSSNNYSQKARLTDEQKKNNHNTSEQARRQAIREQFEQLANMMPGWEGKGASEAKVMEAAVGYLKEQLQKKGELNEKGVKLDGLLTESEFDKIYNDEAARAEERQRQREEAGDGNSMDNTPVGRDEGTDRRQRTPDARLSNGKVSRSPQEGGSGSTNKDRQQTHIANGNHSG